MGCSRLVMFALPSWRESCAVQALRVVMVVGVLECGYLLFNGMQDRLEDRAKQEKRGRMPTT